MPLSHAQNPCAQAAYLPKDIDFFGEDKHENSASMSWNPMLPPDPKNVYDYLKTALGDTSCSTKHPLRGLSVA